jgi:TENA/THI-4/PQQC family
MTADALVSRHTAVWQAATVHPFHAGARDGSVPEDSFDRWLAQDYLYVQALVHRPLLHRGRGPYADVGLLAISRGGLDQRSRQHSKSRNSSLHSGHAVSPQEILKHSLTANCEPLPTV